VCVCVCVHAVLDFERTNRTASHAHVTYHSCRIYNIRGEMDLAETYCLVVRAFNRRVVSVKSR
jgi:hypothetical protein